MMYTHGHMQDVRVHVGTYPFLHLLAQVATVCACLYACAALMCRETLRMDHPLAVPPGFFLVQKNDDEQGDARGEEDGVQAGQSRRRQQRGEPAERP